MSPYEDRYVDVKFVGRVSGSVSVAVEEGVAFSFIHCLVILLMSYMTTCDCGFLNACYLSSCLCRFSEMAAPLSSFWVFYTAVGTSCQQLGSFLL